MIFFNIQISSLWSFLIKKIKNSPLLNEYLTEIIKQLFEKKFLVYESVIFLPEDKLITTKTQTFTTVDFETILSFSVFSLPTF